MQQNNPSFDRLQAECQTRGMTKRLLTLFLALGAATPGGAAPAELDDASFPPLHALMQPAEEGRKWLEIPWRTNLWQARIDAAEAGKPIYLWEMDGHPLGCT